MAKAWMPLYVADYLAATTHLDAAESGAYLHLIMHYWQHGGLPVQDRRLAHIARMTSAQWERARPTILEFFHDGWRHERVERELREASVKYERRVEAGRKGGNAKNANRRSNGSAASNASEECKRSASKALAAPCQPQPQPQPQSQPQTQPQTQPQPQPQPQSPDSSSRKESNDQDPAPPRKDRRGLCAFEAGIIRLDAGNLEKWRQAFPNLSLESELIGLAAWAAQQTNWFIAVSGALAKKQREAVLALERIKAQASLQAPGSTYVDPRL